MVNWKRFSGKEGQQIPDMNEEYINLFLNDIPSYMKKNTWEKFLKADIFQILINV
jgi:hypothetical protein